MPNDIRVKICGLTEPAALAAAIDAGASYVGFTFFPASPRNLDIETARELALSVPPGIAKVALTVDPTDEEILAITEAVPLDMLQLHGVETIERVLDIKAKFGLPVMKAVGVSDRGDLASLDAYSEAADQILVDAKPPKGADLPGGNGLAFDWRLLEGRAWSVPWMLAGGLTSENVGTAIALTGANQVDVSSGVEAERGVKDPDLIRAFISAAWRA